MELSPGQQKSWEALGWNQNSWDSNLYDTSRQAALCWKSLNAKQLDAALSLCFNEEEWNTELDEDYGINCSK